MKHILLINVRAHGAEKAIPVTCLFPAIAIERVVYPMGESKPMHVSIAGHEGYLVVDGLRVFDTFEAAFMDETAPKGSQPASGAALAGWQRPTTTEPGDSPQ